MPDFEEISGIKIQLPEKPKKKDILFSNLPKKKQKWSRTEMPSGLSPETASKYAEFISQEFDRRANGV